MRPTDSIPTSRKVIVNSTFPSTGTWFSRWHHLYTEAPATIETPDHDERRTLPRTSQFTTAA